MTIKNCLLEWKQEKNEVWGEKEKKRTYRKKGEISAWVETKGKLVLGREEREKTNAQGEKMFAYVKRN